MRSRWTTIGIVFAALAGIAISGEAVNILPNGDFEADELGVIPPKGKPKDWAYEAYGQPGCLEIVEGTRPGGKGKRLLAVNGTAEHANSGVHSQLIPIDPHTRYMQTGWVKASGQSDLGGGGYIGIAWYDAAKKPICGALGGDKNYYTYVIGSHAGDTWRGAARELVPDRTPNDGRYEVDEIPANAAYCQVWALIYHYDKTVWFDDLTLVRSEK